MSLVFQLQLLKRILSVLLSDSCGQPRQAHTGENEWTWKRGEECRFPGTQTRDHRNVCVYCILYFSKSSHQEWITQRSKDFTDLSFRMLNYLHRKKTQSKPI